MVMTFFCVLKRWVLAVCLISVTAVAIYGKDDIMTFNIRNGIGIDGVCDLSRIAEVISDSNVSVVAVQEVDSMTLRSGQKYVLGELAAMTAMHPFFSAAIDYDSGKYGVGLLCREEPDSIIRLSLPGREEARTAIICIWDDRVVCSTHLSLDAEDALAGIHILAWRLQAISKDRAVFLAGDFNSHPDSAVIAFLESEGFTLLNDPNSPTFPSDYPEETLDYIMCLRPNRQIVPEHSSDVIGTCASDHRPVVVRFTK